MKRLRLFAALLALLLVACVGEPDAEQSVQKSDGPVVTVYRAPT